MKRSNRLATFAALALAALPMCSAAVVPPAVPALLEVPADQKAFLLAHAAGTQNYVCLPSATAPSGFAWTLFGPQATLFTDRDRQVATHFLSANPDEVGLARATWLAQDSSAVWAVRTDQSVDSDYVDPNAIPWFRLKVVGRADGPSGGRKLSDATWVQRVHTVGGKAPATGCAAGTDVGAISLVAYEADYVFFKPVRRP